jgi:flagellar motor switch protein FliN/FliY
MNSSVEASEIYAAADEGAVGEPSSTQLGALLALPVSVAVSVGRVRTSIEQLLSARPETILKLDSAIEDPVELLVGEQVIARGRLVDFDDGATLGVEITEIVETSGRR